MQDHDKYELKWSTIQVISIFAFGLLGAGLGKTGYYLQNPVEAMADLDKPPFTPSSMIAHDEDISIHRERERDLKL